MTLAIDMGSRTGWAEHGPSGRIWYGTAELDTPFRFPMVVGDEGRKTGALCLEHEWSFASQSETGKAPDDPYRDRKGAAPCFPPGATAVSAVD